MSFILGGVPADLKEEITSVLETHNFEVPPDSYISFHSGGGTSFWILPIRNRANGRGFLVPSKDIFKFPDSLRYILEYKPEEIAVPYGLWDDVDKEVKGGL